MEHRELEERADTDRSDEEVEDLLRTAGGVWAVRRGFGGKEGGATHREEVSSNVASKA